MRVIARIPDASAPVDGPRSEAKSEAGSKSVASRRACPSARFARALPTWSVAALAVIAIVSWVLASWNEHSRLQQQRSEMRVARQPVASPGVPQTRPASDGAVVR